MLRIALVLVAVAFFSLACDDPGFEQASEITKLRVLAIRMDPPELGEGDVATIDALVVEPDGAPVRYVWELCAFDEGPNGAYACGTDEDGEPLGAIISESPTAQISYDDVTAFVGSVEELCDALSDVELPDFVELPSCERGLAFTLRLTVSVRDGEGEDTETAVKSILLLKEGVASHANPQIGEVLVDGSATTAGSGEGSGGELPMALQVIIDPEAHAETYENSDGEARREELALSWYATAGRFDYDTTYFAEDVAPLAELQTNTLDFDKGEPLPADGRVGLWLVLRDSRGGLTFTERTIFVRD